MSKKKAKRKVMKKAVAKKAVAQVKKKEDPIEKDMIIQDAKDEAVRMEAAGEDIESRPRTPGTMGRPSDLDPELVERALALGFTKNQVNGFTENGPLQAACDRCKPIVDPPSENAAKKRRPVRANEIPDGAVDHVLELKAVTTAEAFSRGQNRAAFDNGIISSAMFQLVKDNRSKYKIWPKILTTVRHEVPDKAGNYITDVRIVVALGNPIRITKYKDEKRL